MSALHESKEMSSQGNSTATRIPLGKPATGRPNASVQNKGKMNVLMSLLTFFGLCIPFAGWKENLLLHIAQTPWQKFCWVIK
jgi:hypothetical protein